jgi:8-oxo-dGTP diphosphatase
MAEIVRRPAARVVCFDPTERILVMRWRDPVSGRSILEPPGGGIEPGERAIDAARRELLEETGRRFDLSEHWAVDCERDFEWAGRRVVATERFYGALTDDAFDPDPSAFTASEASTFLGADWLPADNLASPADLAGELEPPNLAAIVAALVAIRPVET